jgi:hypothetical protein
MKYSSAMRPLLVVSFAVLLEACGSGTSSPVGLGAGGSGGASAACALVGTVCNGACLRTAGQTQAGCSLLAETDSNSLAVSGSDLYFTSADRLGRVDTNSLQVSTLFDTDRYPSNVLVAGDTLYFGLSDFGGQNAAIESLPTAGGTPTLVTDGFDYLRAFALSGSTLYFTSGSEINKPSLRSAPVSGGASTVALSRTVITFTVDASTLYFVPYSATRGFMATIEAAPLSAPNDSAGLAALDTSGDSLLTDAANVYYCGSESTTSAATCGSIRKEDGTHTKLAASAAPLLVEAVDARGIVLLETGTSGDRLLQVPLAGGAAQVLATFEVVGNLPIAVDATHVYVGADAAIIAVAR